VENKDKLNQLQHNIKGDIRFVIDEETHYIWNGSSWVKLSGDIAEGNNWTDIYYNGFSDGQIVFVDGFYWVYTELINGMTLPEEVTDHDDYKIHEIEEVVIGWFSKVDLGNYSHDDITVIINGLRTQKVFVLETVKDLDDILQNELSSGNVVYVKETNAWYMATNFDGNKWNFQTTIPSGGLNNRNTN